jgi:hypothetical protein
MNEREFAYWLRGDIELNGVRPYTKEQVQIIKDHLDLIMIKATPDRSLAPPVIINPPLDCAPYPGPGKWEITCSSTDVYNPTVVASCSEDVKAPDDVMWAPENNQYGKNGLM